MEPDARAHLYLTFILFKEKPVSRDSNIGSYRSDRSDCDNSLSLLFSQKAYVVIVAMLIWDRHVETGVLSARACFSFD